MPAGVRRDGEAGRHGEADVRHLGKVGPLAAKKVLKVLVAFSEGKHKLRHCKIPE
jgi:hypothetical protein